MLGLQVEQDPTSLLTPLVRERFASVGVTVAAQEHRSPDYLARFIPRALKKWAAPIAASGASAD
jgi:hypothetical protein